MRSDSFSIQRRRERRVYREPLVKLRGQRRDRLVVWLRMLVQGVIDAHEQALSPREGFHHLEDPQERGRVDFGDAEIVQII